MFVILYLKKKKSNSVDMQYFESLMKSICQNAINKTFNLKARQSVSQSKVTNRSLCPYFA